jgi:hypothetical protein
VVAVSLQTAVLSVVNAGGSGHLAWEISELPAWISADKHNGTTPDELRLTTNSVGLQPGETQKAELVLKTNDEIGQSIVVEVTLTSRTLFVGPPRPMGERIFLPTMLR